MFASIGSAQEFRALWVDAFHNGFKTAAQVDTLISEVRTGNFNAVVVEVRKRGDAYYNSNYEPKATDISASFDPLADLITKAHNTNNGPRIEVHAWLVSFNIWNNETNAPTQPTHPYNLHPDWLIQDDLGAIWDAGGENYAFDPGHPEVQLHTFNVAMDIVTNYNVDGINFDYIRYAGNTWGYNPVSVDRFNRKYGLSGQPAPSDALWLQFRRDQVSALVRKVYLSVAALKPQIKISADTITWSPAPTSETSWTNASAAYTSVLQDWRTWMQEGILDLNIPMTYFDQTNYPVQWANWNSFAKDHRYNRHVAVGPGTYLNSLSNALYQMRYTRTATAAGNFADGLCAYSYAVPIDPAAGLARTNFFPALTKTNIARLYDPNPQPLFVNPATVPVMPWKSAPSKGHLKGFVYGIALNNPLDGSSVTVTGSNNRAIISDATGFYGAVDLVPGNYNVTASGAGFGTASSNFTVVAGSVVTIDLLLPNNDTVPPLLSNIRATNITSSSADVLWTTDESANSIVDYALTTSYGVSLTNPTLVVGHAVNLSGLSAGTTYHFRVRSKDGAGNSSASGDFTFTTLPPGVVSDIIVDNIDADIVGSWSTGSASADKFGSDYRFKSAGAGAAWLEFSPNIATPGRYAVYEWHPQGGNRTSNAFHIVTFDTGQQSIVMNQKTGGGQWNLLGIFRFNAGSSGNVRITDTFPDAGSVVMADAIKFVFVPPPQAPGNLTATLLPPSKAVLSWSDLSTNESGFVVSRSSSIGGPFSDILFLPTGQTSATNSGLALATTYYFKVRATNALDVSDFSNVAQVTTPTAPSISTPPHSLTVNQGSPAGFSVVASGTGPLAYQWRFNATDLPGATGNPLNLGPAQPSQAGGYSVVVSNSAGIAVSSSAALIVNVPPSISVPPQSQTVKAGSNVTFSVTASGSSPLSYQWRFNGDIISGAISSSYTVTNAQPANGGSYSVRVNNMAGIADSAAATLTVTLPSAPKFLSIVRLPGSQVRMSLSCDPASPYELQGSLDLTNWSVLTRFTNDMGTFTYDDDGQTNGPQRFYRARWSP